MDGRLTGVRRLPIRVRRTEKRLGDGDVATHGNISKAVHAELTLRLKEARQELLQEHEKLSDRARFLQEAREQFDSVQTLVSVLPEILTEVTRDRRESNTPKPDAAYFGGLCHRSFHPQPRSLRRHLPGADGDADAVFGRRDRAAPAGAVRAVTLCQSSRVSKVCTC